MELSHNTKSLLESCQPLNILYIEDSKIVRESTLFLLEEYFEHIDTAVNGEEGLNRYTQFYERTGDYYDIVITDINMPKMDGISMLESIYRTNSKAHTVVTSAHNEPEYLLKLIEMGVSNFILKPMKVQHIEQVLSRVIQSINDQKKLDQYHADIQKEKENAVADSLQKSQFLANMSHEIRTPLNAITGFITLLNEKENDPTTQQHLQVIKNSSDSLLQIISDILDISKIESGKLEAEPTNFNPYDNLITIVELFQVKAAEKGVVLKVQYNNHMPKTLYCDVFRIKQILTNMLSNAVKFTPEGATIRCVVWYDKGRLNIRVKDQGIGIAKEKQQYVFNAFAQADNSTVREYGGTGLGLAISRQLTQLLGGELTLESEIGKGTVFKLSIPMPLGDDSDKELDVSTAENTPLDGHVLVVEDYEANRMFVGIILENAGVTYDMAHNGLEAVEMFKKNRYGLILMDENMPKLGGIGAAKEILKIEKRKALRHTPIISLTANALKGDRERFLSAGMDDYISKPVEPGKLLSILRKYLVSDA